MPALENRSRTGAHLAIPALGPSLRAEVHQDRHWKTQEPLDRTLPTWPGPGLVPRLSVYGPVYPPGHSLEVPEGLLREAVPGQAAAEQPAAVAGIARYEAEK